MIYKITNILTNKPVEVSYFQARFHTAFGLHPLRVILISLLHYECFLLKVSMITDCVLQEGKQQRRCASACANARSWQDPVKPEDIKR